MAIKKRSTHHHKTSLFALRRAKRTRFSPDVPLAVSNFAGCNFVPTWRLMKFAVYDRWLKRVDGGKRYVAR